jgi:hypothetical protein
MTVPARFVLQMRPTAGGGWTVDLRDPDGGVIDGSERTLAPLPLPHPDDLLLTFPACHAPLAATAPDAADLHALDANTLGRWYANMASGQASDGMPRRFGRYLFELVLGAPTWAKVLERADGAAVDLRLDCPADAWPLMRLPWELMHDGQHFLAARPGPLVLMSRQITAPVAVTAPRPFAPRVLFVIGSLQDDAEIRAGAEYLGLLRRLQALDLTLDCHVLRDATAEMLQSAVADFQPSVVHFICHGGFSDGRGALRLLTSDPGLPFQDYTAPQLLALLATTDAAGDVTYPPVLVLNACYSATPLPPAANPVDSLAGIEVFGGGAGVLPTRAGTLSLGAELVTGDGVRGGPGLVIGMGGKVADLACRLFTRQFYQSLLRGDPTWSAAAGRRGAFIHGFDPLDTVDWATPVVFVEASATMVVDDIELESARKRESAARQFRRQADPPAFCGRLRFFDQWRDAITPPPRGTRRLLGIAMSDADTDKQVGGSRLLEELAVAAVHAGHVPCLRLHSQASPERPTDIPGVVREILAAALSTRLYFGLPAHPFSSQVLELTKSIKGRPAVIHPSIEDALAISEAEGFRAALQMDLWQVRDEVVAQLGTTGGRRGRALAVVLVDEVQRYAGAAGRFIVDLLRSGGLGTEQDPIPVAFTYRKDMNYAEPYEQVRKALDAVSNWALREELQPLREAVSDRSIYLHLLLHRAQPLVFSPTLALLDVDRFYNSIHRATASGYPSQFREKAEPLNNVLLTLQDVNVVVRATDEDVLSKLGDH